MQVPGKARGSKSSGAGAIGTVSFLTWLLGIEVRSSAGPVHAFNCKPISQATRLSFVAYSCGTSLVRLQQVISFLSFFPAR